MVTIPRLDILPVAYLPEGWDAASCIKSSLLFGEASGQIYAIISPTEQAIALNAYSSASLSYPLAILDPDHYEALYLKFLELKTDAALPSHQTPDFADESLSLIDFLKNSADLLANEESAPIIKFVNTLFYQAIRHKASDIHIETHEKKGEVRFRIDGVLVKHLDLDKAIIDLIISRIKVISNLDISERRLPQDGRTRVSVAGKNLDIRVSVLPTYHGERIVMRLLMHAATIPTLQELGFDLKTTQRLTKLLDFSHGIILVTGPTGSGKSTTLHAFLQQLADPTKNIISIEDPVEYDAPHVSQIAVNTKVGLTFASGLRSILRQDPDIIMVGEIRDTETAHIAIQAAMTGHLVFSTLHTNNATSALTRLEDMGIENFLITSTIRGVLAQRLVRKVCPHCHTLSPILATQAQDVELPLSTHVAYAQGCQHCNDTGYLGRVAVGELFVLDTAMRQTIVSLQDDTPLRLTMRQHGFPLLSDQLRSLVLDHITTVDEVIRVGIKEA